MRKAITVQMSLTLLIAFFLAPFQHIHTDAEPGHAEAGEIHAHLFFHEHAHHQPASDGVGIGADDDDDHAHAQSIDGYTIQQPRAITLALPTPAIGVTAVLVPLPITTEHVEARANSPPAIGSTSPRPPPL